MANAPAATHALGVLKLLGAHAGPMPAAAIARDLGLPRSTVYHLLAVLRDEGFVVHLPEQPSEPCSCTTGVMPALSSAA